MDPSPINFKLKTQAKQQNCQSEDATQACVALTARPINSGRFVNLQVRWAQRQCEFNRNESPMWFPYCLLPGHPAVLESLTLLTHWVQLIRP